MKNIPPDYLSARRKASFFLVALVLLALFLPLQEASAVLVAQWDFSTSSGSYSGTVSPGNQLEPSVVTGSVWNVVTPFSGIGTGYVDQNGASLAGVTMQFAKNATATIPASGAGAWGVTAPSTWGETNTPSSAIYNTSLMKDYLYTGTGGILGVRVSGLPAGTYKVYVPEVETLQPARARTIGIGTGVVYSQFGDAQAINAAGTAGSVTTWVAGVNYACKQVTITGPSDYINVLATDYSYWDSPSINGLQIVAVPESQTLLTQNANIGSPSGGGSTYDAVTKTYVVTGKGAGIQTGLGTTDMMHFTYTQVTGDIEMVARVVSFDNAGNSQVGLAMRTGTGTGDQHGACFFNPYHEYFGYVGKIFYANCRGPSLDGNPIYYTTQTGAGSARPLINPPFWFKLVRIGNNFGSYWSLNGRDWVLISNASGGVFFAPGAYNIGFFVSSGSDTAQATATFDNVYVGPPRLKYKTSWIGATSGSIANGNPSNQIYSLWVKPDDGTCYANSNWDETGGLTAKIYKDGKVLHAFMGVSQTQLLGNTGAWEGGITGNATHIFLYSSGNVYRTDLTGNVGITPLNFTTGPLGEVRGLAASATTIFVSDYEHGLVRAVDAATLTEINTGNFPIPFPRCGPIAYDGANFWITQAATGLVGKALSWNVAGTDTPRIKCYTPAGVDTGRSISDVVIPTALAYDNRNTSGTSDDRLWVCDNGPLAQNVRYYTNLTGPGNPTFAGTFGQAKGLWATGSTPGKINNPLAGVDPGGDQRFYGPVGVGVDKDLNVYVACNGGSHAVTDIRKFNSAGTMQWRVNGLIFVSVGDFDPASDGQEIYTPDKHFSMNYANTVAGSEWNYTGYTRDLTKNANEGRNKASSSDTNVSGVKLARLGAGNSLYMYTSGQGQVYTSWLYYFNGETAVPFGTNGMDGVAPNTHRLWIDTSMNGAVDTGEAISIPLPPNGGDFYAFDLDSGGDIWMTLGGNVRRIIYQGTRTLNNGAIVPNYSLAAGGYVDYLTPLPIKWVTNLNYDRANDVLYAMGVKQDYTWVLLRCDKWLANAENKSTPAVPTWSVNLTPQSDITILYPSPAEFHYAGMDVAGGKIFIAETYGPIHVYDTVLGNPVIQLIPGPEHSALVGWEDMSMGLNAFKRSTGEYLVTEEHAGIGANNLLYRWIPTGDTAVTTAPTGLTATASGRKVVLSWNGPMGTVTSYKIYRSTSSGTETLYLSGLTSPTFTDLNVTPGTTYYYKITAVNSIGESAQSNEASGMPVSAQVEFVKLDMTTQGSWKGVYGAEGYEVCGNAPMSLPGTIGTVSSPGTSVWTYVASTTDVRALQKANPATDRIVAWRYANPNPPNSWIWNITFTDGIWHQVALYMVDWIGNHFLFQTVSVLDKATGTVLYSRTMSDLVLNFNQGQYLVLNVSGDVQIQVSNPGYNYPQAGGLFIDPIPVATPSVGWWKLDNTSGTIVTDSSGAGNNMTLAGTGNTWNASGKINGCLNLTGAGFANFPASLLGTITDRTFCTWIYKTATSGAILGGQALPNFSPILYFGTDGKLYGSYNTGTIAPMVSPATVSNNAWHHVALTRAGSVQRMYLDGAIVGTMAGPIAADYASVQMGSAYTSGWPNITGSPAYYSGKFDDARLYNRALNPWEISKLAQ